MNNRTLTRSWELDSRTRLVYYTRGRSGSGAPPFSLSASLDSTLPPTLEIRPPTHYARIDGQLWQRGRGPRPESERVPPSPVQLPPHLADDGPPDDLVPRTGSCRVDERALPPSVPPPSFSHPPGDVVWLMMMVVIPLQDSVLERMLLALRDRIPLKLAQEGPGKAKGREKTQVDVFRGCQSPGPSYTLCALALYRTDGSFTPAHAQPTIKWPFSSAERPTNMSSFSRYLSPPP